MNRNNALAAIWIGCAGLIAGMQFSDLTSILIAAGTGALTAAYMTLYVFTSSGKTYLWRVMPLLAMLAGIVYCMITKTEFYGLDQVLKGFYGYAISMFVVAAIARLWPAAKSKD
ncbi:MAG: hypothetical protein IPG59_11805 [Candidatus Melainabacteria bacterium]|nr:MAG: hypothetical protein IPG59_11805 [Candidatus Melainabacteria bacterium]